MYRCRHEACACHLSSSPLRPARCGSLSRCSFACLPCCSALLSMIFQPDASWNGLVSRGSYEQLIDDGHSRVHQRMRSFITPGMSCTDHVSCMHDLHLLCAPVLGAWRGACQAQVVQIALSLVLKEGLGTRHEPFRVWPCRLRRHIGESSGAIFVQGASAWLIAHMRPIHLSACATERRH